MHILILEIKISQLNYIKKLLLKLKKNIKIDHLNYPNYWINLLALVFIYSKITTYLLIIVNKAIK